ncbi:ATP-grasp domain-containing protein [Qipengyuania sp. DY56-A-20]|uniref:ATP-grasp domain-containing protein n=1 Tax=Qipengyuania benthica TaxID=3067651 RepID=A0ABT9H3V9_9SPHN|nr:ATP-grasp domain-containing protein [Qipengyuania sp. DY56-A-20]MDP4538010.1 ATP-grasp domain-containing protein [Qipengyuania sp. DY56-A-20]
MTKILVTGAGALLGQGIIRALQRSGLNPYLISVDPSPLSAGLYWTDEYHLVPKADAPEYLDRFSEVLHRCKPDLVLVGTDVELLPLAENRARLEQECGTTILVSDPEVVHIADDKYKTFLFFRDAGFDAPESAIPENSDDLEELIQSVGFPLIVKPRVGARSFGVSTVLDRLSLDKALKGRAGLVVQKAIGSSEDEYTSSVVAFGGKALASIVMRRDLRDGNTYRAFSGEYPNLNRAIRTWGEALGPFGPANFQFRIDADGKPKVFEINARFSGATPLRAMVGFNEVEMCVRHLLFEEDIHQPSVAQRTILRHWSETLVPSREISE